MSAEPWLRGGITDLDPMRAAILYSFRHAREDIELWTSRMPEADLCMGFGNVASVGFHVRHIAGSVDRLMTYVQGEQLTDEQMQAMRKENEGIVSRAELLKTLDDSFARGEAVLRSLDTAQYNDIREIGRRRMPVPLGVLLVHIAEHTQRHVGEIIMTVKIANEAYR
jgi:uncharacterized damage-inducible protein DinB